MRFYVDELGLEPLPTPDFGFPVVWLRAGERQVHLFDAPGVPPSHAHFGLEIADFMHVYRRMKELGALDHVTFGNSMYELPDGGIQMYVRDPAGNLVELDHPDASTIPPRRGARVPAARRRPAPGRGRGARHPLARVDDRIRRLTKRVRPEARAPRLAWLPRVCPAHAWAFWLASCAFGS